MRFSYAYIAKELDEFLAAVDAKPSTKERHISHIYWVYMKYCILNNKQPISKIALAGELGKRYERKYSLGNETRYLVDCELFNLKYEDKVALIEYKKEEHQWRQKELAKRKKLQKLRRTLREKKLQLKKEKEARTPVSIKSSSVESNKNTTTSITLTDLLQKIKNS